MGFRGRCTSRGAGCSCSSPLMSRSMVRWADLSDSDADDVAAAVGAVEAAGGAVGGAVEAAGGAVGGAVEAAGAVVAELQAEIARLRRENEALRHDIWHMGRTVLLVSQGHERLRAYCNSLLRERGALRSWLVKEFHGLQAMTGWTAHSV